jgi:hypothetical protein
LKKIPSPRRKYAFRFEKRGSHAFQKNFEKNPPPPIEKFLKKIPSPRRKYAFRSEKRGSHTFQKNFEKNPPPPLGKMAENIDKIPIKPAVPCRSIAATIAFTMALGFRLPYCMDTTTCTISRFFRQKESRK